jgi:hypothetical protein
LPATGHPAEMVDRNAISPQTKKGDDDAKYNSDDAGCSADGHVGCTDGSCSRTPPRANKDARCGNRAISKQQRICGARLYRSAALLVRLRRRGGFGDGGSLIRDIANRRKLSIASRRRRAWRLRNYVGGAFDRPARFALWARAGPLGHRPAGLEPATKPPSVAGRV